MRPFWSPDGRQVRFLDRREPDRVAAIWGLDITGGEPAIVTNRLGIFSPDALMLAYPSSDGRTHIQRTDSDEHWVVPSGGRPITFSPDGQQISWQVDTSKDASYHGRSVELWLANVDGRAPQKVITVTGGGIAAWFPSGNHWLVRSSELSRGEYSLTVLDLNSADELEIARAPRLSGASLSPGGVWVAFQVTASGNKQRDGLWVVRADGQGMRRLDVYGSYQWRSEGQLAIVPLEVPERKDMASHRLLQVDAATGTIQPLTDPTRLGFRIANGDWAMAPGGKKFVYVSAEDHNLWLIDLP